MKRLVCCFIVCCFLFSFAVPFAYAEDITKSNADVVVKVGEKYTLEAVINYMMEKKLPFNVAVKWETSDAKIATVSNGVVKGVGQGGVIITASAVSAGKTYQAQAKVYVVSTVTGVTLNTQSLELKVGQTDKLIERILPDTALLKTVAWKSENTKVATVSNGTVKGVGEGFTYITVTASDGGYSAKCGVKVTSTVTGIALKEHILSKKVGEVFTIDYTVLPETAFCKDVKWTSGNTKVVSVTGGKLKALAPGSATVKVETVDGKHTDECVVNVGSMVTGITLSKNTMQIVKGSKEVIAAVITPDDAVEKGVIWKSADTSVAKVADGVVTAVKEGQTTISATTKDGSLTATVAVTVISYDKKPESIDLLDSEVTMNVGENKWFLYKVNPPEAVVGELTVTCTLINSSRTQKIQLKNDAVYLEALTAGDYNIVLSLKDNPDINDSCIVHIKSMVTGIALSNSQLELAVGEKVQLKGNALPDTAIIKGVTWKSSAPQIAKVNSATGEVVGVSEGDCTITATTIGGGLQKTCNVTVKNAMAIENIKIRDAQGNIIGEAPEPAEDEIISSPQDPILITIDGKLLETDQPPVL